MASHQAIGLVGSSVEESTKAEVLRDYFGLKMTWLNVEKKKRYRVMLLHCRRGKKRFLIKLNRNEMKT